MSRSLRGAGAGRGLVAVRFIERVRMGTAMASAGCLLAMVRAQVYLGRWRWHGLVAVKQLIEADERREQAFVREAELLQALRHPNIVSFLGACLEPRRVSARWQAPSLAAPHGMSVCLQWLMPHEVAGRQCAAGGIRRGQVLHRVSLQTNPGCKAQDNLYHSVLGSSYISCDVGLAASQYECSGACPTNDNRAARS